MASLTLSSFLWFLLSLLWDGGGVIGCRVAEDLVVIWFMIRFSSGGLEVVVDGSKVAGPEEALDIFRSAVVFDEDLHGTDLCGFLRGRFFEKTLFLFFKCRAVSQGRIFLSSNFFPFISKINGSL